MGDWEVYHAVHAQCPCGFRPELVRCDCEVSRTTAFAATVKDVHPGLAAAREAIQPHLDQTGHRFPTLEHRFVYAADGVTQDFRTWDEAVAAGSPPDAA
jgi:hypothetical protein